MAKKKPRAPTSSKPPCHSDGSRKLAALVKEGSPSRADVASQLGVDWTTVHRWILGQRSPGSKYAGEMERLFGIPARLWSEGIVTKEAA